MMSNFEGTQNITHFWKHKNASMISISLNPIEWENMINLFSNWDRDLIFERNRGKKKMLGTQLYINWEWPILVFYLHRIKIYKLGQNVIRSSIFYKKRIIHKHKKILTYKLLKSGSPGRYYFSSNKLYVHIFLFQISSCRSLYLHYLKQKQNKPKPNINQKQKQQQQKKQKYPNKLKR